jgi:lactobin A/cerein 7B family class IIb bacteriocin
MSQQTLKLNPIRQLNLSDVEMVSGGIEPTTAAILIGVTAVCPLVGAMMALGYYTRSPCER